MARTEIDSRQLYKGSGSGDATHKDISHANGDGSTFPQSSNYLRNGLKIVSTTAGAALLVMEATGCAPSDASNAIIPGAGAEGATPSPEGTKLSEKPTIAYTSETQQQLEHNIQAALEMTPKQLEAALKIGEGSGLIKAGVGSGGSDGLVDTYYRGLFVDAVKATVTQTKDGQTLTQQVVDVFTLVAGANNKPVIIATRYYDGESIGIGKVGQLNQAPGDYINATRSFSYYKGQMDAGQLVDSLGDKQFDPNHLHTPQFNGGLNTIEMKRGTVVNILSNKATYSSVPLEDFLDGIAQNSDFTTVYSEIKQKYGDQAPVIITRGMNSDQIKQALEISAFNGVQSPAPVALTFIPLATEAKKDFFQIVYAKNRPVFGYNTTLDINGEKVPTFIYFG